VLGCLGVGYCAGKRRKVYLDSMRDGRRVGRWSSDRVFWGVMLLSSVSSVFLSSLLLPPPPPPPPPSFCSMLAGGTEYAEYVMRRGSHFRVRGRAGDDIRKVFLRGALCLARADGWLLHFLGEDVALMEGVVGYNPCPSGRLQSNKKPSATGHTGLSCNNVLIL
jgi:hypothetical protein